MSPPYPKFCQNCNCLPSLISLKPSPNWQNNLAFEAMRFCFLIFLRIMSCEALLVKCYYFSILIYTISPPLRLKHNIEYDASAGCSGVIVSKFNLSWNKSFVMYHKTCLFWETIPICCGCSHARQIFRQRDLLPPCINCRLTRTWAQIQRPQSPVALTKSSSISISIVSFNCSFLQAKRWNNRVIYSRSLSSSFQIWLWAQMWFWQMVSVLQPLSRIMATLKNNDKPTTKRLRNLVAV